MTSCVFINFFCLSQARDDDRNGDLAAARTKGKISLGLNLTALVVVVLSWTAYIVAEIVVNTATLN